MDRLRLIDLHAAMNLLHDLYGLHDVASHRSTLLARLPSVVPCDLAIYCENDFRTKESRAFTVRPEDLEEADMLAYTRRMHESPLVRAYRRGRGSAVKYSDFMTRLEFRRTGLYNDFFRKRGTPFRIAKGLPGPRGIITSVFLDRSGSRDFDERDRLLLNLLRPHLNQSYQNAVVVASLRDEVALFAQGLDDVDAGVVHLGADGHSHRVSPRARAWLQEFFGGSPLRGNLPDALARWVACQGLSMSDDLPTPIAPMVAETDGARLSVRLLLHGSGRILLLQRQTSTATPECPRSLGLSPREADVMAWVAQGKTNAETAIILRLSRRTVDKHLEHIYAKLGVENRLSAVTRVRAALEEPTPAP